VLIARATDRLRSVLLAEGEISIENGIERQIVDSA
jgi:hypothetical protein